MKKVLLPVILCAVLTICATNSDAQTGNTKLGLSALTSNSTGDNNTAIGYYSLHANTTGYWNTAIGSQSLRYNTTGQYNTAGGYQSLFYNTYGQDNTAYGTYSLLNNSTGYSNTANGSWCMRSNTTGSYNTAGGSYALFYNTTGNGNTVMGYYSLYNNTTGSSNTANGYQSLYYNTYGTYNTGTGSFALYNNTTGYYNTAYGNRSLYYNTTGYYNTATGYYSQYNTTGSGNTSDGYYSLYTNTGGSYNTALGYYADVNKYYLTNATAIGYNAIVNASNKVRIGNTAVTSIGGQVGWTTFSDGRYKNSIKENVPGLAFINSLRPITYTVNVKGLNDYYNKGRKQDPGKEDETMNGETKKGDEAAAKIVYNGFIAQEVEEAAKKLNFEFSGVDKPQDKNDLYGLRYDNFVIPLVKAVQELSKLNDEKDVKIDGLQKQINELKATVSGSSVSKATLSDALLDQNMPNPFIKTTTIDYILPQQFTNAQILITDKYGKILKQLNISGSGKGTVNVDAATLSSGTYNYSLIADGKIISTKQMILTK